MITIFPPELEENQQEIKVFAKFEIKGRRDELWYSLPIKFKDYLVTEQVDAFVVGLLLFGMKTGEDIYVAGTLSSQLHYTLNHYLIKAINLANAEFKNIKIIAETLSYNNLNIMNTAGTGISCGVDSFATYFDHINDKPPFAIEYFTYFNVGSHGDLGGTRSRDVFNKRFERIRKCASDLGKEIIKINSNLSEILKLNFQQTHSLRSVSCVLLLQKLFKNYYYASSIRFDQFRLDKIRIAEYDLLNLQMLSTESTSFWSSAAQYTRLERLDKIAGYPTVHKYLDVCTNPHRNDVKYLNCSRCYKCIRTMLLLDFYNKLNLFNEVFDLDLYKENKDNYIALISSKENKETQDYQLLRLLKENKRISGRIITKSVSYRIRSHWRKIKRAIKSI
jgi:hypothetical protein